MAFSTKISFVPRDSGEKSVSFDEVDYGLVPLGNGFVEMKDNILNNFKSFNFREISDFYTDFVAVLETKEFLHFHEIHHKCHFEEQPLKKFISEDINLVQYNWVVIEVYEWESGLD